METVSGADFDDADVVGGGGEGGMVMGGEGAVQGAVGGGGVEERTSMKRDEAVDWS